MFTVAEPKPPQAIQPPPRTEPTLVEQLRAAADDEERADREAFDGLISRSHAPQKGDAPEMLRLSRRLGMTPESLVELVAAHVRRHQDAVALAGKRAEIDRLDAEYAARFRWAKVFLANESAPPNFEVALTRLIETVLARARFDRLISADLANGKLVAPLLRARGWTLRGVSPERWADGAGDWSPHDALAAQFTADLAPLRGALEEYDRTQIPPFPDVPDEAVDARLTSLRADVEAFAPVEPKLAKWVSLATVAKRLWVEENDPHQVNGTRLRVKVELSAIERDLSPGIIQAGHFAMGGNRIQ